MSGKEQDDLAQQKGCHREAKRHPKLNPQRKRVRWNGRKHEDGGAGGRAVPTFPRGSVPRTPGPRAGEWGCCRTAGAPGSRSHRWCCRETTRSRGSSLRSWGEEALGSLSQTGSEFIPCAPPSNNLHVSRVWTVGTVSWEGKENRSHRTGLGVLCHGTLGSGEILLLAI